MNTIKLVPFTSTGFFFFLKSVEVHHDRVIQTHALNVSHDLRIITTVPGKKKPPREHA